MDSILTIIKQKGKKVLCQCECGNQKFFWLSDIQKGKIKSCGCLRYKKLKKRNTKHGESKTDLYKKYRSMISRCKYKSATGYKNYGGRGISVCKSWSEDYLEFKKWSLNNGYEEGLSLERIDVNGNYEPSNCSWIPFSEQQKNKRPFKQLIERDEKGRFITVEKQFI